MRELRGELGLAEEHLHEVGRVGEVRQDPLDRDAAIEALEPALLREEHLRHPAARDAPQEHVLAEPNAAVGGHVAILARIIHTPPAAAVAARHFGLGRPRSPAPGFPLAVARAGSGWLGASVYGPQRCAVRNSGGRPPMPSAMQRPGHRLTSFRGRWHHLLGGPGMKYLLALSVLAACTTERNPDVCCTTDADCARLGVAPIGCRDGFVCTNFTCVAAACTADTDCAAGAPVCDLATATCAACTSSADCDGHADAPVCDTASGGCRACRLDAECASDVCDVDTGRCMAEADVIYASATGSDAATCTRANPCSTTRAIVVAGATPSPSTVRMLPGTYGVPIVVSSGSMTIFGSGAKLAPALGVISAVEVRDTANLEIRGIDIDRDGLGAALSSGTGALFPTLSLRESTMDGTIYAAHGKVRLRRSVVADFTPALIQTDGTLEADQTRFGSPSSFGLLRTLGERMTVRITNSIFDHVTLTMANSDVAPDKSEYYVAFSTFILDAGIAQDCSNMNNHPRVAVFENNILFSQGPESVVAGTSCTLAGNITYPQDPDLGGTNIDVDPRFVSVQGEDYRLQPGSPAIDAAGPASGPNLDHDFAGTPRPQGSKKDIGAYESVP